jgi:hypothetical protein
VKPTTRSVAVCDASDTTAANSVPRTARRLDLLAACAAAAVTGAVYGATMFPGLVGIGDTPKLQFIGAVLGTPHSPGYPLYVMLSWLFAQLPVGTLAFRINLFSVVCGALATGLFTLILRELRCGLVVSLAGAMAIAFGRLFWSQAILAEVYMLNALLFGGVLLFLLRWSRTRSHRDLAMALGFFGAGLAHHLTLAMTGPALLGFALTVDRKVITWRTFLMATVACCAGLALYGFLWIRTATGAAFLEVRASSLGELIGIISARQFHRELFLFTPYELLTSRLPLVTGWIAAELRWPGLALAVLAVIVLVRRRSPELLLIGGCFAIVSGFALNYHVYDVQVFLIIPLIALGLLAGIGADLVVAWMRRIRPHIAVSLVALLVPLAQIQANLRTNNQREHTYETRFFNALFDALPNRTAIVSENYPINHMVLYKTIGEHAARGRRIELIRADAATIRRYVADGFTVFAFEQGQTKVQFDGVTFRVADLDLPNPAPIRHMYDSEASVLAYGLSVVTGAPLDHSPDDSDSSVEPINGAELRVPR